MELIHGGDTTGYRLAYGRTPLDFSASLNPMGMPQAVKAAAIAAVAGAEAYPDPLARQLTSALAGKLGVRPESILVGNGSAELIYRLAQAVRPRRALLPVPAFAEYERALCSAGCEVCFHTARAEQHFELEADLVGRIEPGIEMVLLCQPGNPTGRLVEPGLLRAVLRRCREVGALLFVDECFLPFVPQAGRYSLIEEAEGCPDLFILGSFTKLYAMAGLRLGYGVCTNAGLLAEMARHGQPWPVSYVAQQAGLAALGQTAYLRDSLAVVETEKAWLQAMLEQLGFTVLGGAANYLFFGAADTALAQKLAGLGILIRDCANFRGLSPGYYRIAVRTQAENEQLAAALAALAR